MINSLIIHNRAISSITEITPLHRFMSKLLTGRNKANSAMCQQAAVITSNPHLIHLLLPLLVMMVFSIESVLVDYFIDWVKFWRQWAVTSQNEADIYNSAPQTGSAIHQTLNMKCCLWLRRQIITLIKSEWMQFSHWVQPKFVQDVSAKYYREKLHLIKAADWAIRGKKSTICLCLESLCQKIFPSCFYLQ